MLVNLIDSKCMDLYYLVIKFDFFICMVVFLVNYVLFYEVFLIYRVLRCVWYGKL